MISSNFKFKDLQFENNAANELRIEENNPNKIHLVGNYHYSKVHPSPLPNP